MRSYTDRLVEKLKIDLLNIKNEVVNKNLIIENLKANLDILQSQLNLKNKKQEIKKRVYFSFPNEINTFPIYFKPESLFVEIEAKLYKERPEYKKYLIVFLLNGEYIKRFYTMEENKVEEDDIIEVKIINNFNI